MMTRAGGFAGAFSLGSRSNGSPETIDRALVIACAVIWLLVLGMGVAATVALVDLGRSRPSWESGSGTSWLLYLIIAISALVIAVAIPLLLRARRDMVNGSAESATPPAASTLATVDRDPPGYPGPTPAQHSAAVLPAETLDRMWLRCGVGVLTATGAAMFAVALATYLLAIESTGGACGALVVAGVITAGMAAIPVMYLRELHATLETE
jgi:hypothetical protein